MKKEEKKTSTNGRWGITVVIPVELTLPIEGKLIKYGEVEGHTAFEIIPEKTGIFFNLLGEVEIHGGAEIICSKNLQSSTVVTLVAMSEVAIIESFGYKGRSSSVFLYQNGIRKEIPAGVLASMGLIKGVSGETVAIEIQPVKSAMQIALEKAGLVK